MTRIAAGSLRPSDIGKSVSISGWVQRRRDHGGIAFIDVRDASGVVQVVADPAEHETVADLKMEYCISVTGVVRARPEGTANPDLPTGGVEVGVDEVVVLAAADTLPFMIEDRVEIDERARLRYRYLDLRRPRMGANLRARSRATAAIRRTLDEQGFLEVETPTLVNSTPEGARDMLVPSRLRRGEFYALPQSPQLFKQLLMIAGVERYFQIARCYRDEDFRADRQLEFTQLDLEGSFWDRDDVLDTIESVLVAVVKDLRGVDVTRPFLRLTWQESMDRFGTDKPDMRFGAEIVDLSRVFEGSGFGVFSDTLDGEGTIRGINVGPQDWSRGRADAMTERAKELGGKGLVWMVAEEDGSLRSPVAKFLDERELAGVRDGLAAKPGDILLIAADRWKQAVEILGALRNDLLRPTGHDDLSFLWVIDFPLFEEAEDGTITFSHHPFTSPSSLDEMRDNPTGAVSKAYDAVLNGVELGSGSVRIHDPEVQRQVFDILGIDRDTAERRFGWFLEALRYGTPPHAGFAFGIDRLVMVLQGETSIREVIPFPKTQSGVDPMTGAPTWVDQTQLDELGIGLTEEALARQEQPEEGEPLPPAER
ncbi:MAG: aspartate--tRNA ligase [Acidimicrobiia bacterium]